MAVAQVLERMLARRGFAVRVVTDLGALRDHERLLAVDLLVPNWTMGTITGEQLANLLAAVRDGGVGVAGVHGGMGDAFRAEPAYHELVGGQWVAHPGDDGVTYRVRFVNPAHPLTRDLPDFTVSSEQYYMHVDPAIEVLADTTFGSVIMPVAWVKTYGRGRVFYCSVGHRPALLEEQPLAELLERGFTCAARSGVGERGVRGS